MIFLYIFRISSLEKMVEIVHQYHDLKSKFESLFKTEGPVIEAQLDSIALILQEHEIALAKIEGLEPSFNKVSQLMESFCKENQVLIHSYI